MTPKRNAETRTTMESKQRLKPGAGFESGMSHAGWCSTGLVDGDEVNEVNEVNVKDW